MNCTGFSEWLIAQQDRQDVVGQLAAHAAADVRWPLEATYTDLIGHLVETLPIDRVFAFAPALQAASREYAAAIAATAANKARP